MVGQESKQKILDLSALKSDVMNLVLAYFKDNIYILELIFHFRP